MAEQTTYTLYDRPRVNRIDVAANRSGPISENAFLGPTWSPDLRRWVTVRSPQGRDQTVDLRSNYWGTTSPVVVRALIEDYEDDFNLASVLSDPFLTTGSETTYPFVSDVRLSVNGIEANTLGPEQVSLTVTFNRDMDVTTQPQVGFGPAFPYRPHRFRNLERHAYVGGRVHGNAAHRGWVSVSADRCRSGGI